MESWMVTGVSILCMLVGQFALNKYQIGETKSQVRKLFTLTDGLSEFMNTNTPVLNHFSKIEDIHNKKLENQSSDIVELKTKLNTVPTMKEVKDEFLSKEMFKQFEKHMDSKFEGLQVGQSQILTELREVLNERK